MKIKVKEKLETNDILSYEIGYENKNNSVRENKVAIDYLVYKVLKEEKNNNIDNLINNIKNNYLKRKESEENE